MTRYWIFDRDDTPQGFALRRLVHRVRSVVCEEGCEFVLLRSQGYGTQVCEWDAALDESEEVRISADELETLCNGKEEWFYNLVVKYIAPATVIRFGVHDSTCLFLEAPSNLAAQIIEGFEDVRIE